MKNVKISQLVILALGVALAAAPAAAANQLPSLDILDISREPGRADWRYFIRAPDAGREKLWAYHASRGQHLKDWAWGWRLGWVRVCGESARPLCGEILRDALFDKALVVRAEAATRLGRRYEGSGSDPVVELLAQAYRNPKNLRHGKPLFVQSRILYALRQIGGSSALAMGKSLAASQPEARAYWTRLEDADAKL